MKTSGSVLFKTLLTFEIWWKVGGMGASYIKFFTKIYMNLFLLGKLWEAITQSILAQISKVGPFLKSSLSLVFKTHLTFEIWATNNGVIEGNEMTIQESGYCTGQKPWLCHLGLRKLALEATILVCMRPKTTQNDRMNVLFKMRPSRPKSEMVTNNWQIF